MSSASVFNTMFGFDVAAATAKASQAQAKSDGAEIHLDPALWNVKRFGREQIRSLVQQVFFPGHVKAPRQVVFSAVDQGTNVGDICLQVGQSLAAQTSGSVCIVEVTPTIEDASLPPSVDHAQGPSACLRDSALPLSRSLWLVPSDTFMRDEKYLSAAWLRGRIDELRLDFDYTIFHAPSAGEFGDASLLGHLCDGVVLVLTANVTRRVTAKKVKELLHSANAALLGTILNEREFPIPEGIYRRL